MHMKIPSGRRLMQRMKRATRDAKSEFAWRFGFNLLPTLAYKVASRKPGGEAARVATDLTSRGVATTTVGALFGEVDTFAKLCQAVEELEATRAMDLEQARAAAHDPAKATRFKTFTLKLLATQVRLPADSLFRQFGLQPAACQVADAYFGMRARMSCYDVWHTFASVLPARDSQLWHQDPEDRYILKMFVYLSDVDEGAGPFTYAPGTHRKGAVRKRPDHFVDEKGAWRTTDEQMAAIVEPEKWITATGPRGTVVFADTRGYHKGGLARTQDRLMYLCMFTSRAAVLKDGPNQHAGC